MRELFVYWRTAAHAAEAAQSAVRAWQQQLRAEHPRLQAALYRRADEAGSSVTLMEVYAALDTALEQRIVAEGNSRLGPWIEGQRKVEVFVPCTSGPTG